MNDLKVKRSSARISRRLVALFFCAIVILPLYGCFSKSSAKPEDKTFPLGAVVGHGKVASINPDLEVLTLQLKDRQVPLWISKGTEYYHGKNKISVSDIKPGSQIEFEGWSFGTDVTVKKINLK